MKETKFKITFRKGGTQSVSLHPIKPIDFYNERGDFLYRNYNGIVQNSEIRLIKQNLYDKIEAKECLKHDFSFELEFNSKVITINAGKLDFKKMLDDSNLESKNFSNSGENRRMEQAALMLYDTEKLEIRLEIQDDSKNDYESSSMYNGRRSPRDRKVIWQPIGKIEGDEKVMVIGTIHTHPVNYKGEEDFGHFETNPEFHGPDVERASQWQVPFFHLYPVGINEVDVIVPGKGKANIDNLCTTKNLLNGKYNLLKKALEIYGNFK